MFAFSRASTQANLIPPDAISRLDWLANMAYFRGFYGDASAVAVTEFFAPALANGGWPRMETPEMHDFFAKFLGELRDVALREPGLTAAGAHLVSIEVPYCSYAPEVAEIRMQIYRTAAEFIKPRFDEIEWPAGPCAARDVFAP